MTAARDPDRLIQAFLTEGQTELPDRVFDEVRRETHRTRQRVVLGRLQEPNMSILTRLAIAAAIVVAIGAAWFTFLPPAQGPGVGPSPSPSPTPSPTPSPSPNAIPLSAPLEPGRYTFSYAIAAGSDGRPGPSITVTVPAGWVSYEQFAIDKNYGPSAAEAGPSFVAWRIENRYVDPCAAPGTPPPTLDPSPGPGIDELLETLANQPGLSAGPLTPVTVDGHSGKFVELTVTTDIATCQRGFYPWLDKFVQGNNEVLRVYAIDVNGFRLTFFARIPARTTPADRAELESIIASVEIGSWGN